MKNQVLHTGWCNSFGETAGEIWSWSPLGVKGLNPREGWVPVTHLWWENTGRSCWRNKTWASGACSMCTWRQGRGLGSTRTWWRCVGMASPLGPTPRSGWTCWYLRRTSSGNPRRWDSSCGHRTSTSRISNYIAATNEPREWVLI